MCLTEVQFTKRFEVYVRPLTPGFTEALMVEFDVLISGVVAPVTIPERVVFGRSVFVGTDTALILYWIYHLPLVVSRRSVW